MDAKVFFFNSLLQGGASIAAQRLFDSLVANGVNGSFFSFDKSNKKSYKGFPFSNGEQTEDKIQPYYYHVDIYRYLNDRPSFYELFSLPFLKRETFFPELGDPSLIIHLHWIAHLIDYPSFFRSIPNDTPIVWTLHDMNPFTGGCHYAWECDKFVTHCHTCPQLNDNKSKNDLSFRNFRIKLKALQNKNIHIVAGSKWIEQLARKSTILKNVKSIQTIYCGLNTNTFYPINKSLAKTALGIADDSFVIAFGAEYIHNRRKGFDKLIEALKIVALHIPNAFFLIFGNNEECESVEKTIKIPILNLGFLKTDVLLNLSYSAADIFVIPSIYESFGQTSLEAMACCTPVVGFKTGGIPEMVKDFETGLMAVMGDSIGLANKIIFLYSNKIQRIQMGINARKMVEEKFSIENQTQQYIKLYEKLKKNNNY
jgi:glycosyltransferase involved in cell wall biosynthesis